MSELKEYKIEDNYGYMEITVFSEFSEIKTSIRKGDCYVLGYEEAPESGNICISSDIEVVVRKLMEELNNPSYYWYEISSWENGKRIDGNQIKSR